MLLQGTLEGLFSSRASCSDPRATGLAARLIDGGKLVDPTSSAAHPSTEAPEGENNVRDNTSMPVRLLFVEKDVTTSDLLVPDLEKKGYRVFLARTRRHAMRRCRSVGPDILVVDVASFGTAGHDLLEALRLRVGSLPYILLLEEGHGMAGDQAQAFMTAPFTSRKLLYRLRKVAEALPSRALCA